MTWTVDESKVMPFLTAAERRDVLATLWRPVAGTRNPSGPAKPPPDEAPAMKSFKDFKDTKDFKDRKDYKDTKDTKDFKDLKDLKDRKDFKDTKDSKDFKDSKDVTDGAWNAHRPSGVPVGSRPPAEDPVPLLNEESDDILSTLRSSRASRFLRERGLVI